jgi:hypothetical protein
VISLLVRVAYWYLEQEAKSSIVIAAVKGKVLSMAGILQQFRPFKKRPVLTNAKMTHASNYIYNRFGLP